MCSSVSAHLLANAAQLDPPAAVQKVEDGHAARDAHEADHGDVLGALREQAVEREGLEDGAEQHDAAGQGQVQEDPRYAVVRADGERVVPASKVSKE